MVTCTWVAQLWAAFHIFILGLWCLHEHREASFLNPCMNKTKQNNKCRFLTTTCFLHLCPWCSLFTTDTVSVLNPEKNEAAGDRALRNPNCLADMAEKDKDKTQSLCRSWRKMTSLLPPCLFCWCVMCGWGQDGMYTCHGIQFFKTSADNKIRFVTVRRTAVSWFLKSIYQSALDYNQHTQVEANAFGLPSGFLSLPLYSWKQTLFLETSGCAFGGCVAHRNKTSHPLFFHTCHPARRNSKAWGGGEGQEKGGSAP